MVGDRRLPRRVRARLRDAHTFAPGVGVAEDPACGSMNASVGQWLTQHGPLFAGRQRRQVRLAHCGAMQRSARPDLGADADGLGSALPVDEDHLIGIAHGQADRLAALLGQLITRAMCRGAALLTFLPLVHTEVIVCLLDIVIDRYGYLRRSRTLP
jgi:hypothetical protein